MLLALQFSLSAQVQPNTQLIGKWPYGDLKTMLSYENFLLVGSGRTLQIYDYSVPNQPVLVSEVSLNDAAWRMRIIDEIAYVACDKGLFAAIDIADPARPELLMEMNLHTQLMNFFVVDQYAYILVDNRGIYVYDITEFSNPVEVAHLLDNQDFFAIEIRNDTAYIGGVKKVLTFAMPDPLTLEPISSFVRNDFVRDIALDGNKLYGLCSQMGMFVLDISDPASMTLLSVSDSISYAGRLTMEGDMIAINSSFYGCCFIR